MLGHSFPTRRSSDLAVAEIGRSSYVFSHALYRGDGECAATGRVTMVLIDRETRRSRPLPPVLIERLALLKVPIG